MKLCVTGGREIETLVTWTINFIEIAANTQETILFAFQLYFYQIYKGLMSHTFVLFPHFCPFSEDNLHYLLLYC